MMLRALILLLALAPPAAAQERLVAGLSQESVAITAAFDGSDILVFGAVRRHAPPPEGAPLDVIITVEGPRARVDVRHKTRELGIWINTETASIAGAPSFYAVASTRPLADALSLADDTAHRITIPRRVGAALAPSGTSEPERFSQALVRLRKGDGHYREEAVPVALAEETLFSASFALPADLIAGEYQVRIFLARNGRVIDTFATGLDVRKVGLEQFLFWLAHAQPLVYGLLSLALAVAAGWAASTFFRMIRN